LINPYWSLLAARRDELHCASEAEVDDSWLRVVGVSVSPQGFRPADTSVCLPEPEQAVPLVAAAVVGQAAASVPLSGVATTTPVTLDQFDPAEGTLERVTITVTVDAGASVNVTNLTAEAKPTTVVLDATATAAGPGVGGLAPRAGDSGSATIGAGASSGFTLTGTGGGQQVITDPFVLAQFVGPGTVTFDVTGAATVDIQGPATWRPTGSIDATATVTVDYNTTTTPPSTTSPPGPTTTTTPPNDPPTATDDASTVDEDAAATPILVLANDSDPDPRGMTIDDALVTQPTNGTVVVADDALTLTYQPNADYCNTQTGGTPDTFTYTLAPGGSSATVSVTVTCVDDAPVAVNDEVTVVEDDPATTIDVLANDTDVDAGPIAVDAVTQPTNGTVAITNSGADLTYQPDANYCYTQTGGTPDTLTYTLVPGGSTATVTVTVACVGDTPVAVDDTATVIEEAAATTIDVLANDVDPDPVAVIDAVTQPTNGTVAITNSGADLTYQPNANYCNNPPGTNLDTFTYTLTPGGSTATVTVTETCVDDGPVAVADAATVAEDAAATAILVLANDTNADGGPISIASTSDPANGTVTVTGGGTGLTYQPDANYCNSQVLGSPDTFSYTLTPGGSTATVTVTETCVDDGPMAVADAATVVEDAAATAIAVLANDTDVDAGPRAIGAVTQPVNGLVVITGGGTGLTYQPNANYCNNPPGTTLDTFTYTLTPGGSIANVSVTVTCVHDPPVAVADSATVIEDAAPTAITVLANDTDINAGPKFKSIASATDPANGTVAVTGGGTGLTYQPDANYCNNPLGTTLDTFTYTLNGGSTATVSVTVTCVNDPPVAGDDSFTGANGALANTRLVVGTTSTGPNLTVAGSVLSNDTDVDTSTGLTASPALISSANCALCNNVTMEADGTFIYDPPAGFTGNDTFTYTVNDNDPEAPANQTDTATVTIQVVGPLVW
jgi:VCBS repeat-containing protein